MMALPLVQDVQFDYTTFTPIMKMGDDYTLVTVTPDSPYETCSDVVDAARDGRVVAAVSGATSLDEIVFSLIEDDQDVEFDRVPYESGSEVLAGLLGGHVDVASLNPGEIAGQLESGDLKALCALAPERYEYDLLADIPTGQEQGIDVAFAQFRGYIAPGGIDEEAKQYWIEAGQEFEQTEAFTEYIESNYMQAAPLYGDEFTAYLDEYNENLKNGLGIE
jgi:putative tricarboxylic transport membrane protein